MDSGPSPTHGELGYGTPTEEVPRSSTVPKIVDQLEGARVRFVFYLPAAWHEHPCRHRNACVCHSQSGVRIVILMNVTEMAFGVLMWEVVSYGETP